jgi:L-ascorbate metabolism protein UlaG (beta-lactamase superfamily)
MRFILTLLSIGLFLTSCKNQENKAQKDETMSENASITEEAKKETDTTDITIQPISHATAVINWDESTFYVDPVGGAQAFEGMKKPDFILITDIHGDHMSAETLQAMDLEGVKIIVPQAVKDELPAEMNSSLTILENGATTQVLDFSIKAIPMYNLPEDPEAYHPKGRGNGYVIEHNGKKLYIAGDTEDIPEMRNLEGIDVALIPMNLPYTMTVEDAAAGVLAFSPEKVIPYHFRGQQGYADVEKFKSLVNQGNKDIKVEMLNWYPNREE